MYRMKLLNLGMFAHVWKTQQNLMRFLIVSIKIAIFCVYSPFSDRPMYCLIPACTYVQLVIHVDSVSYVFSVILGGQEPGVCMFARFQHSCPQHFFLVNILRSHTGPNCGC
jgi:hypothetical protein